MVKLFSEPQYLKKSTTGGDDDDLSTGFTTVDVEEQNAGYQAAYSRLAAAERPVADPVAYAGDPQEFVGRKLAEAAARAPAVRELVARADQSVVGPFVGVLRGAGVAI
jgi:exportin-2 (importin alpha re-exporter)